MTYMALQQYWPHLDVYVLSRKSKCSRALTMNSAASLPPSVKKDLHSSSGI